MQNQDKKDWDLFFCIWKKKQTQTKLTDVIMIPNTLKTFFQN